MNSWMTETKMSWVMRVWRNEMIWGTMLDTHESHVHSIDDDEE